MDSHHSSQLFSNVYKIIACCQARHLLAMQQPVHLS
jgi:hypothetical protein